LVPVIVVAGDVAAISVENLARLAAKSVPDGGAFAVGVLCAFDLIC
jgi:phosphopantothenate synthetase